MSDEQLAPVTGANFSDAQFAMLIAALTQNKSGFDRETLTEILTEAQKNSAGAMQKALHPENDAHPGKSAFAYPEGDVSHPRPALPYEMWWNGFPIHRAVETHHWSELELLVALKPGVYQVIRKDGALATVTVRATKDPAGKISRMDIEFPVTREERHYIAPMFVWLWQMSHPELSPRLSFMKAMQRYLEIQMLEDGTAVAG